MLKPGVWRSPHVPKPGVWGWTHALALAAVALAAWTPGADAPSSGLGDKLDHLAAFGVLTATALAAWPRHRLRIALGLAAYGVLIELVQNVAPGRHASAADVLADLAGIALGLAAGQVVRRVRAARAERAATVAPASRTPP